MRWSASGRAWGFIDEALASGARHIVLTVNQFFTAARVVAQTDLLTVMPRHFRARQPHGRGAALRELPLDVMAVHVDALWHKRGPNRRPTTGWCRPGPAAQQALALQHPL
jgi:DNA-binding transcriptional LysR family regulator